MTSWVSAGDAAQDRADQRAEGRAPEDIGSPVCSCADALDSHDDCGPAADREQGTPTWRRRRNARQAREKRDRPCDVSARKRLPSHAPEALPSRAGPGNDPLQHLPAGEGERGCDRDGKRGSPARSESGREGEPLQGYQPWRSDTGDCAGNLAGWMQAGGVG
jgi:hypothetical protein